MRSTLIGIQQKIEIAMQKRKNKNTGRRNRHLIGVILLVFFSLFSLGILFNSWVIMDSALVLWLAIFTHISLSYGRAENLLSPPSSREA